MVVLASSSVLLYVNVYHVALECVKLGSTNT